MRLGWGDFGFARHDPNAPSVEVVIELHEQDDITEDCCPFL